MKSEDILVLLQQFEAAVSELDGVECWSARELQPLLGYSKWENFEKVLTKVKEACANAGEDPRDHFPDVRKGEDFGKRSLHPSPSPLGVRAHKSSSRQIKTQIGKAPLLLHQYPKRNLGLRRNRTLMSKIAPINIKRKWLRPWQGHTEKRPCIQVAVPRSGDMPNDLYALGAFHAL